MPEPGPAWRRNLPNALTLLRVALAVVVVGVLSLAPTDGSAPNSAVLVLAAVLFIAAALTDALDGHLARTWNVTSPFGRVMDPFADKLLVIGTFICLAGPGFASVDDAGRAYQTSGVAPWMVVAILGRELLVTSIRAVFEARGVNFAASWSGKIKMILQSGAIPTILLMLAFTPASPGSVSRLVILGIVWAAVIQTVWSGVPYILRAMRTRSDPTP